MKRILQFFKQKEKISLFGWRKEVPLWVILIFLVAVVSVYKIRYQSLQGQWKTYTNNQYGYSIDYPSNWFMKAYGSNGFRGSIYLRDNFVDLFTSSVYIYEKEMVEPNLMEAVTWGEGLSRYASNWSDIEITTIGQGNYEAMVRSYVNTDFLGRGTTIKVYYLVTDHQVIALEFDPHEKDYDKAPEAFDQMLDSFQLVDIAKQE